MKNSTYTPSQQITEAIRKRETRGLLREINASAFHLRDQLLRGQELDELEVLNDYLRHVLLRLEESCAEGRLLR
jgi:hypothetical protein